MLVPLRSAVLVGLVITGLALWTGYSFGWVAALHAQRGVRIGEVGVVPVGVDGLHVWGDGEAVARVRRAVLYERLTEAWVERRVVEETERLTVCF